MIHQNVWPYGRKDTIVLAHGKALCHLSVDDECPNIAYLTDVIVHESIRGRNYGNKLLKLAIEHAREMGADELRLWARKEWWVRDWYGRKGFKKLITTDEGWVQMTMSIL